VEVADVLIQHVERFGKDAPGAAGVGVCMADGVDVRSGFVNGRVDQEACCICGSSLPCVRKICTVPLNIGMYGMVDVPHVRSKVRITNYLVPSNNSTCVDIETYQVTGRHEAEVSSKRVHPNIIFILWIPHADMPRHTFREAFAGKVTKDSGCVDEDVLTVFSEGWESWDACLWST